jgi:hypothetical protein
MSAASEKGNIALGLLARGRVGGGELEIALVRLDGGVVLLAFAVRIAEAWRARSPCCRSA